MVVYLTPERALLALPTEHWYSAGPKPLNPTRDVRGGTGVLGGRVGPNKVL